MTAETTGARRRIKVGVLIGALDVGGAESDIVRNFPRLDREKFEVVIVLFCNPGPLAPEVERQGIRVVARFSDPDPLAVAEPPRTLFKGAVTRALKTYRVLAPLLWVLQRFSTAVYMWGVTRWVGRTFADERIDIGHFFLPHSYAYGMAACRFWRPSAKTVMSRLSLNFYKDSHRFLAWLERNWLHRAVDVAIGNSKLILDELAEEGVDRSKLRLLYNGIDLEPFVRHPDDRERAREELGLDRASFVVLAVGNLHTYKGHRDLIDACASARDELPDGWRLLIAGRDQQGNLAAYREHVRSLGLEEHIQLLGPREDVSRLLAAADVFVQPSHHEGLPNAIVEAMAASLPVIGTRVGGIPEVVTAGTEPNATGWIVEPEDVAGLRAALIEAAADPTRRESLGAAGRKQAESEFSIERSVRDYEAIYQTLTA